jgi:hypothetical protein
MRRYYLVDHKILFLFGYLFYFLSPYIIGVTNAFEGYPGIELSQGFFQQIPSSKLLSYCLITLSWLPAFYLGHFTFKLIKPYKRSLELFPATFTSLNISYVAVGLFIVLLLFAYLSRGSLFTAYQTYDVASRGKMSTLMVVYNFFLIYQLVSQQKVSFILITGTLITAALLLSMGGRMYVIQTFIVFLIYKTSFAANRWKLRQIVLFALVGFFSATLVGVWRQGGGFNFSKAAYSLMTEPVFTWFSTSTFLIWNDHIPLFNMPMNFITSFLNLIPNTFFNARQYVVSVPAMGYFYENPLGADSIWTTLVMNFGSAGSFIFMFITGFMLNFLRHLSESSRFWAVYYIMVCGMLPFQFFRDGFFIINKQLFFNFLLVPALALMALKIIQQVWQVKTLMYVGKQ